MNQGLDPKTQRSQRTREAILRASWELLEAKGPGGVTMSAVARGAGVSRRGLYLHFPSRDDLLRATEIWVGANLPLDRDTALAPVRAARTPEAIVDAWAAHLVAFHTQFIGYVGRVDQARRTDDGARAMWEEGTQLWLGRCREVVQRLDGMDALAPDLTAEDAVDGMLALMVAFDGLWLAQVEERGRSREAFTAWLQRLHRRMLLRHQKGRR